MIAPEIETQHSSRDKTKYTAPSGAPKPSKMCWILLGTVWMMLLFNSYNYAVNLALAPVLQSEFSITAKQWALILASLQWASGIFALLSPYLSRRLASGRMKDDLWIPLCALYTVISIICGMKPTSLPLYLMGRLVVQAGIGMGEAMSVAAIFHVWPEERIGFAVGLAHTGFPLGNLLAGAAASGSFAVFGAEGWRYVFLVQLILFPVLLMGWRTVKAPMYCKEKGKVGDPKTGSSVCGDSSGNSIALRRRLMIAAATSGGLFCGALAVFTGFYPAYLTHILKFDLDKVPLLSLSWAVTGCVFQIILPWLSDRFNMRLLLPASALWMGCAVFLIPAAYTTSSILMIQILYGIPLNAVYPLLYKIAGDVAPPGATTSAIAMVKAGMAIGGGALPFIVSSVFVDGWVMPHLYTRLFRGLSATYLFTGILLYWVVSQKLKA